MLVLGLVLAMILTFASSKLKVIEDPRIEIVEDMLPKANCGACGYPGCRSFAEACVSGASNPVQCSVNSSDMTSMVAEYLGVKLDKKEKIVARLACAGGNHVAKIQAEYTGLGSCQAAATSGGSGKLCSFGCLGLGDCERVCEFSAIRMNQHALPEVDEDRCVGCNDCVKVCPKDLFELHPVSHQLFVACKSLLEGEAAEAECDVACTACGKCALDAKANVIEVDRLAKVDYNQDHQHSRDAIERCPTGAIGWFEKGQFMKGGEAKKIIRKDPLPIQNQETRRNS